MTGPSEGRWVYLSGGTTAKPKLIHYDQERWRGSVEAKARLFARYGVGKAHRVAVCHPFSPWAIGNVFAEGAFSAGATVLPLGLSVCGAPFDGLLREFNPDILCGGLAVIARAGPGPARIRGAGRRLIFSAGEAPRAEAAILARERWEADIVDVYGLAEFDMVAAQLPGEEGLSLVPHLEFSLGSDDGSIREPGAGQVGELLVRADGGQPWHRTGDMVEIIGRGNGWGDGNSAWKLRFIRRLDGAVTFADGCMLAPVHLAAAQAELPEIVSMQVVVERRNEGDRLLLLAEPRGSRGDLLHQETLQRIRSALLRNAPDVNDAHARGVITELDIELLESQFFRRTPRGKVPLIWVEEV